MKTHIGAVIRQRRKLRGLRQCELAELSGLKQPNLSRIEAGRVEPRQPTLERLAEALEMSPGELRAEAAQRAGSRQGAGAAAAAAAGAAAAPAGTGPAVEVPVFEALPDRGLAFGEAGRPSGAPVFSLRVPRTDGLAFALRLADDAMEDEAGAASFRHGDVVVLADRPAGHGDFGLVRTAEGAAFRRVFFDGETVRLVPLNPDRREERVRREDVRRTWRLVQHVKLYP